MGHTLGSGECPSCHTINAPGRRFCQECAAPLTVVCLSCAVTMPVWDKVCGECGAKQIELVGARRSTMVDEKHRAESLRREYRYGEASTIAEKLKEGQDQRFQDVREWAL